MLIYIFLVLKWSKTDFSSSGFFIAVPILIFKDLQISIISTILYTLNKYALKQTEN